MIRILPAQALVRAVNTQGGATVTVVGNPATPSPSPPHQVVAPTHVETKTFAQSSPVRVSVLVGTYNRIEMLKRCIESARQRIDGCTYEIVVCDGGSSDGTVEWIELQPDAVLVRGDLTGAVRAYNAAFSASRGEFVLTVNDDAYLDSGSIARDLEPFESPSLGQLAIPIALGPQPHRVEWILNKQWAHVCILRRSLGVQIARICGGLWSDIYRTYGGDTELSCWVHRLGFRVERAPSLQLSEAIAQDKLRATNAASARSDNRTFHRRWSRPEQLDPGGPLPTLRGHELQALQAYEASPVSLWDPEPGAFPARALTLPGERVLHVHLAVPGNGQPSMCAALDRLGSEGIRRVEWPGLPEAKRPEAVLAAAKALQPTFVFLQLQNPAALPIDTVRRLRPMCAKNAVIAVWSGDVGKTNGPWPGSDDAWAYALAEVVDLMLFSGLGCAQMHRARGMRNAAYLQIGYDEQIFHTSHLYGTATNLVFTGSNYASSEWLSVPGNEIQTRQQMVNQLYKNVPRTAIYGSGWNVPAHRVPDFSTAAIYQKSHLAASISLTSTVSRYTSDRLFRLLGAGTTGLVKRFTDCAGLGLVHEDTCLLWDTVEEACDLATTWCRRENLDRLRKIGEAGAALAASHHTWDVRIHELVPLILAARSRQT